MTDLDIASTEAGVRRVRWSRWLHHGGFTIGAFVVVSIVFIAIAAPWIAPGDPYLQDLSARLRPPIWKPGGTWDHPLGTDQFGRDYLSRLIYGSRVSLMIGAGTVAISAAIGITLGVLAGFFGGRVDFIVSFIVTIRLAMPVILVALAIVGLVGSSLTIVIVVLGLLLWDQFAVVTRAAVRQIRSHDYIHAARAIGAPTFMIILQEVLPNVLGQILVVMTLEMAHAILLEASLSFLGLGVQPPIPSWGLMIAEGRDYIFFTPWVIAIPGAALFVLVLGINLLGDGLRDVNARGRGR